jgi:hypothetical protein
MSGQDLYIKKLEQDLTEMQLFIKKLEQDLTENQLVIENNMEITVMNNRLDYCNGYYSTSQLALPIYSSKIVLKILK